MSSDEGASWAGAYDWIKPQPIWWPFTTLHDSASRPALFWIFVAVAAFAVWRHWHSMRLVSGFLALWTAGPLPATLLVSSLIRQLEFPRYVLIGYVGMFAFAGFGVAALHSTALRIALAILIVHLSTPQVHDWLRNYRELGRRDRSENRETDEQSERREPGAEREARYPHDRHGAGRVTRRRGELRDRGQPGDRADGRAPQRGVATG